MNQVGVFVNDSWAMGKLTINAGIRYDRYTSFTPQQQQLAWTTGPVSVAAQTFPEQTYATWNSVVPRIGLTFDLSGDGRTVLKANYGLYYHNPGVTIASDANQNQPSKTETWSWNDANGDKRWQNGEQVARTAHQPRRHDRRGSRSEATVLTRCRAPSSSINSAIRLARESAS